jgi:hypothetical protein
MTNGIYILANDFVYNQLVALLNSIEVNVGFDMPVCIIPYDDRLDKVRAEIHNRPQVTLFENQTAIANRENFATEAWKTHHRAQKEWHDRGLPATYRLAMHRKLCCFDGPFEKFIYFDADTLAIGSVDAIFEKLNHYDWVTNDYQYCSDLKYIFDASQEDLLKVWDAEKLKSHIFCAGWFASKKEVLTDEVLNSLLHSLRLGEANLMALWGPDQSLLNYIVLRGNFSYYNFAFHGGAPGSHWSSQFNEVNHVLYDKGRQLTYLHYMSVPSAKFNQLCEGMDVEIPYRDLFIHYRYLKSPVEKPQAFKPVPKSLTNSIQQLIKQKMSNFNHKVRQITGGIR